MSDRPVVIVSEALPEAWVAPLAAECELVVGVEQASAAQRRQARALLSMLTLSVDVALLDRLPALEIVSNMAVGVDNVDVPACTARGIAVGNTPGVLTDATADLTWALLLASARRLDEAARDAREGRWQRWSPAGWLGADLRAATLGIVGMGKIGYAVAERARGFGVRVIYNSRSRHPEAEDELGASWRDLDALLAESDFLSLHCPLTEQTRQLIDADALARMKPTAHLINTSRGPVVDQAALVRALESGALGGAALDVTDPEPLPPGHVLYTTPRCLVIPHIGSATHGTRRRMAHLACENVLAGLAGEPLPHCVNPR
jgi:glyoxylate reductase